MVQFKIKYALAFAIVFGMCMALVSVVNKLTVDQMIDRDISILASKFSDYMQKAVHDVMLLPEIPVDYKCTKEAQEALKLAVFHSSFARWSAVLRGQQILCESQKINRSVEVMVQQRLNEDVGFAIINQYQDDNHELFVLRYSNDFIYGVSIQILSPRYFVPVECENCIEYTVALAANPSLQFGYQGFEKQPRITRTILRTVGRNDLVFTLSGNDEFYEYYERFGLPITAALAVFLATLFTLVFWHWEQRVSSMSSVIRQAINNKEFVPFYQPIVQVDTGAVVGCEILMRWVKEDGHIIPPNQFIPYAESRNIILEMTNVMLEQVIANIELMGEKFSPMFFSVNIVPQHIENHDFHQFIKKTIESGVLGEHRLSMEITERYPIDDLRSARANLERFYKLGVDLKLDDAGTGYGGFSYIQNLGITTLKIDKMFIDTIGIKDNFNANTLEAIISFSQKSGLTMIAEGVETEEQLDYLRDRDVHLVQGYFYSKPLNFKDYVTYYESIVGIGNSS